MRHAVACLFVGLCAVAASAAPASAADFLVTRTDDVNRGTCTVGDCSLREAIIDANATAGADRIVLGAALTYTLALGSADPDGTIVPGSGDLDIIDALTIDGNGSTIDGGGIDRVLDIQGVFLVTLNDLTIQHGAAFGTLSMGGGIRIAGASVALNNCTIALNNSAADASADPGGGIAAIGAYDPVATATTLAVVTLTNSRVTGNTGSNGGGIVCVLCTLNVTGSTIGSNIAAATDGGGVMVLGNTSSLSINGSAVTANSSGSEGGGVSVPFGGSAVTIDRSRVAANTAAAGSAIFNNVATVTATNNWWGCNFGPATGGPGCSTTPNGISGTATSSPFLVLGVSAAPTALPVGGTATATADLTVNSVGTSVGGTLPDATSLGFSATLGVFATPTAGTAGGKAVDVFTATTAGTASLTATLDGQSVSASEIVSAIPPTVVTGAAAPFTAFTATLNGTANPNGAATTAHFDYGLTPGYGSSTPDQVLGAGSIALAIAGGNIAALTCNTQYHFRAVATNAGGTANGPDAVFTTSACPAPTAVTGAATTIALFSATLNGTADPNGSLTTAQFEYGTTAAFGSSTTAQALGSSVGAVAIGGGSIAGLTCGTVYHFRAVATSAAGTTNGTEATLTTTACPPPTLDAITSPAAIAEDSGQQTINLAGITAGGGATQTIVVTATSDTPSLIPNPTVTYTNPNPTGSLSYTPAADANGSAIVTVTVDQGGTGTHTITRTFTVVVTAVNDPPTLDAVVDPAAIAEDAALQTINLSGIGAGRGESQTLTVTATSSNTSVIPNPTVNYASPSATGSLTYTPVPNASGSAVITVTVDDGGTGTHTVVRTFTVAVTAVNDPPTLNAIADPATIPPNSGLQTVSLAGISAGGGESQTLTVTATSNNTSLIPNPTVTYTSPSATGSLSYTPAAGLSGTAVITVTVTDSGGGTDTFSRTFTVAVTPAPTISAVAPPSGSTTGGTPIAIFGSGFVNPVAVTIGGLAPTNVVFVNATKITATTPAHAAGPVTVVVTNPDAQAGTLASAFTYSAVATNDNFANRFVISGQGALTAGGSNIASTSEAGEPADRFGAATTTVWWSWTAPCSFTVTAPSSFADTIGSGFDTVLSVFTGSSLGTLTELASDDQSGGLGTSRVPAAGSLNIVAGTTYQIRVRGVGAAAGSIALHLNASCSGPAVTSISPTSGAMDGGTTITISGTDFLPGATVSVGGVAATSVNVMNPTTIVAITGAHAAGMVDVVVTNPGPQAGMLSGGFAFVAPDSAPPPPAAPPAPTPSLQPPSAPTALSGAVSGSTVSLAWSAPSSGGTSTNYIVEAGTFTGASDAAVLSTGNANTSLTLDNVTPGAYFVRVRAQNAAGQSGSSNEVVVSVGGVTPPTAPLPPVGLVATVTGAQVSLAWQSPAAGAAVSYQIEAGSSPGAADLANFSTGTAATSVSLPGVPAGTYFVRVRAVNAAGMSAASNEVVVVVLGIGSCTAPPVAPSALRFVVSGSTVALFWNVSPGATTYIVSVGSAPGLSDLVVADLGSPAPGAVSAGVGSGTYFVRVTARNSCGTSGTSNEVAIAIP